MEPQYEPLPSPAAVSSADTPVPVTDVRIPKRNSVSSGNESIGSGHSHILVTPVDEKSSTFQVTQDDQYLTPIPIVLPNSEGSDKPASADNAIQQLKEFDPTIEEEETPSPSKPSLFRRFSTKIEKLRFEYNLLFEQPDSSLLARFISVFILLLILLSATMLCVETLPQFYGKDSQMWFMVESLFVVAFSVELILRLILSRSKILFFRDIMVYLDCLAIAPFYFELFLSNGAFSFDFRLVRIVRVVRVGRIFKVSRYMKGVNVTIRAFKMSTDILVLGVIFLLMTTLVFSATLYYSERGTYDPISGYWIRCNALNVCERSPFQSIVHSMWWCVSTLTTVGYGDVYPISDWGKLFATLAMIVGILVIALPTSLIGANFHRAYQEDYLASRNNNASKEKEVKYEDRLLVRLSPVYPTLFYKTVSDEDLCSILRRGGFNKKVIFMKKNAFISQLLNRIRLEYDTPVAKVMTMDEFELPHSEKIVTFSSKSECEFKVEFVPRAYQSLSPTS